MADALITVSGITAHAYHGVRDFEARDGQEFICDVRYRTDTQRAAVSDELDDTVSYSEVANAVHAVLSGSQGRFQLLEALAEAIARQVLSFAGVSEVTITLHKPHAPLKVPFADVQLRITRTKLSLAAAKARKVAFSLGANLGADPAGQVRAAIDSLRAELGALTCSELETTTPLLAPGQARQPDYVNALCIATTTASAEDLLALCHRLENTAGRVRGERWGARVLDIDIIAIEGLTSHEPHLLLPHPRAKEREFVLRPLAALWPEVKLSGHEPAWWLERLATSS